MSSILGRLRNIEDNDEVARLEGHDIDASTPLWQHDNAWIRVPARLAHAVWQSDFLSRLSFFTNHYAYFIIVCLVSSLIFWGSSDPARSISYVDSLFLVVSAMTAAGLRTVNLSQMTTGQQVILSLLIIFGSRIWVSLWIVYSRKRRFNKRFDDILRESRVRRRSPTPPQAPVTASWEPLLTTSGHGITAPHSEAEATGIVQNQEKDDNGELPYLSWAPTNENHQMPSLTSDQRDELGGIEYRALKLLFVLLLLYFFMWQFLGCIALGAWINNNLPGPPLHNGVKPWWLGIFNGISAFHNSGMSLLDANMIPFQRSYFVLITMSVMILAGNTAFPLLLRLIIWSLSKIVPRSSGFWECLMFILDHPRRLYTHLWPRDSIRWLLFVLIAVTSVNWVGFVLFGLGNHDVESIPAGPRTLDGLFQALCIWFGGFNVAKISDLHIGLQLLYLITMFIPAYPLFISRRRTNVYEERSLAVYRPKDDSDPRGWNQSPETPMRILRYLVRHDTWVLLLAVFVITTIEASHFRQDPIRYSAFNIIFEVASAYIPIRSLFFGKKG